MRARDPDQTRDATRIVGPCDLRRRGRHVAAFYRLRAGASGDFETGIAYAIARCSSIRSSSIGSRPSPPMWRRRELPHQRSRARVAPIVLSLEQHSRRRAARRAAAGGLHEPAVLERQVRRMLADPRSAALRRELRRAVAEAARARRCAAARPRFRRAAARLVSARDRVPVRARACASDRSVLELLTARYTFLDERLARTTASTAWATAISAAWSCREDSPRGGLLGLGSILTATSARIARRLSCAARGSSRTCSVPRFRPRRRVSRPISSGSERGRRA